MKNRRLSRNIALGYTIYHQSRVLVESNRLVFVAKRYGSVPAPPAVFLYWRLLEALLLEALERFLEVTGDQMLRLLNYDYAVYN